MTLDSRLAQLQASKDKNYWAERIIAQLQYAYHLSQADDRKHDDLLSSVVDGLLAQHKQAGTITRDAVEAAEQKLSELSQRAKSYRLVCVAHAHIDMNWMWRWDETVAITLDTFRTMLDLMEEYPDFKFSQSQASVYKIVEDYAPH